MSNGQSDKKTFADTLNGASPPSGAEQQRSAPQPLSVTFEDQAALDKGGPPLTPKVDHRETFLPITRAALIDRLTRPQAWQPGQADDARRFFRYLAYWRQQNYNAEVMHLDQSYEPFSPDTDLLLTRQYTERERQTMKRRVTDGMVHLLQHANYSEIDPADIELIMTRESHYGLDFHIDLEAFEELKIYYRGASSRKDQKRTLRKFFRKEEFDVPIFQRLFILFKLKSDEQRIQEHIRTRGMPRDKAEKAVRKLRAHVPAGVSPDNIYMKLFKNMPRADVEMIFPNTRVKFRMFDKIKLGVTGGGAVGMGVFGTIGKIAAGGAAALNPIALAGALFAIGGVLFRQVMSFFNTHQKYMVVMAQNLYFHSLADNRGVLIMIAERAADEDVKEEMLLYSVIAKESVRRQDLEAVDRAIEQYLMTSFGVNVDFDLHDALERLLGDGLVTEQPDGTLVALPPAAAAKHIDDKWDVFLDNLPDRVEAEEEGEEFEGTTGGASAGPQAQPKEVNI
ncbi:MAG: DUF3754 domain-containing protein [Hyphomicrobiaceae bacterium]|nr:DUF3754 domain-containing protein [Hyphomicrobiaceae bacterium]